MRIRFSSVLLSLLFVLLCTACGGRAMREQEKVDPLEASDAFEYGQSLRSLNPRTVAREAASELTPVETGRQNDGQWVVSVPVTVTAALLERGREQFDIYCSPCHGLSGDGAGIVVQRGFPSPPSLHSERLREAPDGYIFEVITNGLGDMYGYGPQVAPDDRWAIVAYVRVLQLSQRAPLEMLTPEEIERLEEMPQP